MKYFIFEIEIKLGFPEYKIVRAKGLRQANAIMENLYRGLDYYFCGKTTDIIGS